VIAQGSIEELVADRAGELVIECDDTERALTLLAGDPTVCGLRKEHGELRMSLIAREQAGEINSRLVAAGLVVTRLERGARAAHHARDRGATGARRRPVERRDRR
jgi:hypothetical protein